MNHGVLATPPIDSHYLQLRPRLRTEHARFRPLKLLVTRGRHGLYGHFYSHSFPGPLEPVAHSDRLMNPSHRSRLYV